MCRAVVGFCPCVDCLDVPIPGKLLRLEFCQEQSNQLLGIWDPSTPPGRLLVLCDNLAYERELDPDACHFKNNNGENHINGGNVLNFREFDAVTLVEPHPDPVGGPVGGPGGGPFASAVAGSANAPGAAREMINHNGAQPAGSFNGAGLGPAISFAPVAGPGSRSESPASRDSASGISFTPINMPRAPPTTPAGSVTRSDSGSGSNSTSNSDNVPSDNPAVQNLTRTAAAVQAANVLMSNVGFSSNYVSRGAQTSAPQTTIMAEPSNSPMQVDSPVAAHNPPESSPKPATHSAPVLTTTSTTTVPRPSTAGPILTTRLNRPQHGHHHTQSTDDDGSSSGPAAASTSEESDNDMDHDHPGQPHSAAGSASASPSHRASLAGGTSTGTTTTNTTTMTTLTSLRGGAAPSLSSSAGSTTQRRERKRLPDSRPRTPGGAGRAGVGVFGDLAGGDTASSGSYSGVSGRVISTGPNLGPGSVTVVQGGGGAITSGVATGSATAGGDAAAGTGAAGDAGASTAVAAGTSAVTAPGDVPWSHEETVKLLLLRVRTVDYDNMQQYLPNRDKAACIDRLASLALKLGYQDYI